MRVAAKKVLRRINIKIVMAFYFFLLYTRMRMEIRTIIVGSMVIVTNKKNQSMMRLELLCRMRINSSPIIYSYYRYKMLRMRVRSIKQKGRAIKYDWWFLSILWILT